MEILPSITADIRGDYRATYCSFDPQRFIRSAINRGAASIKVALGGNPEEWDLDLPEFRDRVLTWSLIDGLQVSLGIPDQVVLPLSAKRSLAILVRFGIEVFKLSPAWNEYGVPAVIQVAGTETCQTLYAADEAAWLPGEYWLASAGGSVWASSSAISPFSGQAVVTDGWEEVNVGATVLEITSELNGRVDTLPERLAGLWTKELPAFSELFKNDQALSIHYSDRYLRSPWSVMLLGGFLSLFKNDRLASLQVETLEPALGQTKYTIRDDWSTVSHLEAVIQGWLEATVGVAPNVEIKQRAFELQHGRVISVEWASGKRSRIILDQGVGYWRPQMAYRDELNFDFHRSSEGQALQMVDKYHGAVMMNGGSWPTFMTVDTK